MKHKIRPDDPINGVIIIALTVALSANAGFMNGCAVLSRIEVTVSHMTGNLTHMAVFLLGADYFELRLILYIFLSFFVGASLAGCLVPENPVLFGRVFGLMLVLQAIVQLASGLCGVYLAESYWWWCFAAAAAGMQNATFARFTGNLIRTSHMTGVLNDIAFIVGRLALRRPTADAWRLRFLVPSMVAFFSGGLIAYCVYDRFQGAAMFFGAGFIFLLGILYTSWVLCYHSPLSPDHRVVHVAQNTPKNTATAIMQTLKPSIPSTDSIKSLEQMPLQGERETEMKAVIAPQI